MCGIAGIFHHAERERPVDPGLLDSMTRSLAHRGPDGQGVWSEAAIGLGHRRLAILDLSPTGDQPMSSTDGRFVITFNGEIYNFRELRAQLESEGVGFRSTGDSEVIVNGYSCWGRELLPRLNGIFAFAIWDREQRELLLVRDPIGVKPLFYSLDARTLRFASEVKAILIDPSVERELDAHALDEFLTYSYTPAPATGLRAVRQLLPGQAVTVRAGGEPCFWSYWSCPYSEHEHTIEGCEAVEHFRTQLDSATRRQMVSDVPVGAFLSGGLDSAAVVRGMTASNDRVHAISVGFDVAGFDERALARQSAQALDVDLEEHLLTLDAAELLPELSKHLEEPTADSSSLPVYLLCQAAAQSFKVVMSGDGADETLAGYDTYRATAWAQRYRRIPRALRAGLIRPLLRRLPISDRKYGLHQVANRFVYGAESGPGYDHCSWRIIFNRDLKQRLYRRDFEAQVSANDPLASYRQAIEEVPSTRSRLSGLLHADTSFYLPNDMLVKVDRMSMAHGLEVRVPMLDLDFVRYCADLPDSLKLHRGKVRKHVLRECLRPSLPRSVIEAPKSGFNIPVEKWMRSSLREVLNDAVSTVRPQIGELLDLEQLDGVVAEHSQRRADHGHALFTVLMLSLWLNNLRCEWRMPSTAPAGVSTALT